MTERGPELEYLPETAARADAPAADTRDPPPDPWPLPGGLAANGGVLLLAALALAWLARIIRRRI